MKHACSSFNKVHTLIPAEQNICRLACGIVRKKKDSEWYNVLSEPIWMITMGHLYISQDVNSLQVPVAEHIERVSYTEVVFFPVV